MLKFRNAGDTVLVVELGEGIDRKVSALVIELSERIAEVAIKGVVETVPTFRSLAVHYDPVAITAGALEERIHKLADGLKGAEKEPSIWHIPCCYEGEFAPDLGDVAAATGMSPEETVRCHSKETYHVYMVGFLPGFPYLGDLPSPLDRLKRRQNPRVKVPAGSIALAAGLTGVYTLECPGGWHLIGRTPVRLFDTRRSPPAIIGPGDKIIFEPIGLKDYEALKAEVDAGRGAIEPVRAPVRAGSARS